jgi:glutathione S-transferase
MLLYDAPNPAPNPRRVRIYLAEKSISVPVQPVALFKGEHKSPEFLAKYPFGQLPVLELDDGKMIGESISICRYFEALNPEPPLFGEGPVQIAEIDMWLRRIEFMLGASLRNVWVHTHALTAAVVNHQYKDFGESNRPLVLDAMQRINDALSRHPYLAGEAYSMADISLLVTIDFATFIGVGVPDTMTALLDWHGRISSRPSAAA